MPAPHPQYTALARYLRCSVMQSHSFLNRPQVQLHLAVFLFGFTAILGKLISLGGEVLVAYRVGLATAGYLLYMLYTRQLVRLPWRDALKLGGIGLVLVTHWITFFVAIKLVGASVTLVCLSASTFITALVEPLLIGRRIVRREVALGLVVIMGIYLIFHFTPDASLGIIIALISAGLSALVGILNKAVVDRYAGLTINLYELGFSLLVLLPLAPLFIGLTPDAALLPAPLDWLWLALLAFLCTNYAYQLAIKALKHITAFQMILAINLEPIYGIVLASLFLGENRDISWGLIAGMALVLGAVFFNAGLSLLQVWRLRWQTRG
jgi:drug/metabolite transporter (DMT)-like permease